MDDGLINQLFRLRVSAHLPYFLHGTSHDHTVSHVVAVDSAVWIVRGKEHGFQDGIQDAAENADAHLESCFPIYPGEGILKLCWYIPGSCGFFLRSLFVL